MCIRIEQLKQFITNAPVLRIVDPDKDFLVCTDAYKEGISGVWMQEEKVLCDESRKLDEHGVNYAIYDLELASIIHVLKT